MSETDRKFLKFLWHSDRHNEEYRVMRMQRLSFGCKSLPFILNATIKHHIEKIENSNSKSFEMLNSALYVNDLYFGGNNVGESFELSTDAVSILKRGGFNLWKLRSNIRELEKLWRDSELINGDVGGEPQLKVLGFNWNPEKDELSLE
ncbi:uncharacterized protein NPIL_518311 [Nephila pilipes]|nr:uncharacterized protein NPIL_391951 [Nephila pilipes]GFT51938.1 uncharacterized protein NPIL_518311 [Nephila pilipes]